jgi:hypothetical protein
VRGGGRGIEEQEEGGRRRRKEEEEEEVEEEEEMGGKLGNLFKLLWLRRAGLGRRADVLRSSYL